MWHLERCFAKAWPSPRWQDVTVLLAVSGGPDSVALARAVAALGQSSTGRILVAHYNHSLRGEQSDADERFVVELAEHLGWHCHVGRANNGPARVGHSTADEDRSLTGADGVDAGSDSLVQQAQALSISEEDFRTARYDFLKATAQQAGARYVVTAHTADDQAETVLHHIVRGTGLTGLAGMSHARELVSGIALVRPLLAVRRAEVLAYLTELGQDYRVDGSNLDLGFTRNRLRHDLLPQLAAQYNPRIVDSLLRLAALAGEAHATLEPQTADLMAQCVVTRDKSQLLIATDPLASAPRYLVREALITAWKSQGWPMQAMGYEQWELLAALATDPVTNENRSNRVLPGEIVAERSGNRLILSRAPR
jgi:tRNA(Ile)-lysidine synthase